VDEEAQTRQLNRCLGKKGSQRLTDRVVADMMDKDNGMTPPNKAFTGRHISRYLST